MNRYQLLLESLAKANMFLFVAVSVFLALPRFLLILLDRYYIAPPASSVIESVLRDVCCATVLYKITE